MRLVLLLGLIVPAMAISSDALVGEWSTDAQTCASGRVTYTADGRHEGLVFEDGQWRTLATGSYRLEGQRLVVRAGDVEDRLDIVSADDERLVLRNADPARMRAIGVESVSFVRCAPR